MGRLKKGFIVKQLLITLVTLLFAACFSTNSSSKPETALSSDTSAVDISSSSVLTEDSVVLAEEFFLKEILEPEVTSSSSVFSEMISSSSVFVEPEPYPKCKTAQCVREVLEKFAIANDIDPRYVQSASRRENLYTPTNSDITSFTIYADKVPFNDKDSVILIPDLQRIASTNTQISDIKIYNPSDTLYLPYFCQSLTLHNVGLTNFYPTIDPVSLEHLKLSGNDIEKFPEWINKLKGLTLVDLSDNNISDIDIIKPIIRYLKLENNSFSTMPIIENITETYSLSVDDEVYVCAQNGSDRITYKNILNRGDIPFCEE
jgi:hypothetical protein